MTPNKQFSWSPEDIFEITGAQLEALLRVGDLSTIPYGNLSDEVKWKVYGKFLDAKTEILNTYVEKGLMKVEEEKENSPKKKAKAKA